MTVQLRFALFPASPLIETTTTPTEGKVRRRVSVTVTQMTFDFLEEFKAEEQLDREVSRRARRRTSTKKKGARS